MSKKYSITILGAGNGGQAMAGHFGKLGYDITLFNRNTDQFTDIITTKKITLSGFIQGDGKVKKVTNNYQDAIDDADIIMVTTVASAHKEVAKNIAPYLKENQIILLNPGRTLGALEFRNEVENYSNKRVYIAEAQSLIYACRAEGKGKVRIIGVKNKVPLAAYPSTDTDYVLNIINQIYNCFIKAKSVLETSLENIGAIFHPSVVMFNAASIERGDMFYFYNDMTPTIADFLMKLDKERLLIGKSFGLDLISVSDWVSFSYSNIQGDTLCDKMKNNPAYFLITAPDKLETRLVTEDLPTGILPFMELAKLAKVEVPLLTAVFNIMESLLKVDFKTNGRTLKNLGIDHLSKEQFINSL
ncbi:NAD/NADP octopine/nopaline dehydrogenase family protein [Polaribacter sp. MSW13]|uniref:2-dehydropantoate 2-reductase n=1 Tax=Polaribacter marinus TaxID=2916838 RepID=A0A9X1VLQ7_9FLAO|nr:NAD/NADP-dependent octopine/nopaline dehydrogenase family protein [Polaribacter marinus]MCI2228380.1 NAD/NADP octopine/nopaline dehydrogenase family protein [Polaribacter marinus]